MTAQSKVGTGKRVFFALLATVLFFVLIELGFRVVVSATSDRLEGMIDNYRVRYYSHINFAVYIFIVFKAWFGRFSATNITYKNI